MDKFVETCFVAIGALINLWFIIRVRQHYLLFLCTKDNRHLYQSTRKTNKFKCTICGNVYEPPRLPAPPPPPPEIRTIYQTNLSPEDAQMARLRAGNYLTTAINPARVNMVRASSLLDEVIEANPDISAALDERLRESRTLLREAAANLPQSSITETWSDLVAVTPQVAVQVSQPAPRKRAKEEPVPEEKPKKKAKQSRFDRISDED